MKADPTAVSVIICSKDRHQDLERAVASVRAADAIGARQRSSWLKKVIHQGRSRERTMCSCHGKTEGSDMRVTWR